MDRYFTRKRKATRLPLSLNKSTSEKKSAGFFTGVSVLLAFFQRAHVAQVAFYDTKLKENGAKVYRLEDKESLERIKFEPLIVVTDNVSKVLNFIPDHCDKWEFVHKSWLEKCLSKQQVLSTKSYQLAPKDNNDHKNVAGHASASQKAIDSGRDSEDSEDDASKTTLTRLSVDEYQQRKDFASKIPVYCCQRKTLDKPCANEKLYQLFLLLEQRRLLENAIHALAYRRAAAVLRVYPYELLSVEEASWLPCFGAKCLKAVEEYLKTGNIQECVEFEQSERFQCLRLFCGIHGVGPTTACLWYDQYHLRTLQDVKSFLERKRLEGHPLAIKEYGLQYYDDLQQKISRKEALDIYHHVESAFREVDPHLSCCLVGGFRRGQEYGHDVDILGCHRVEEYGHVGKLAAILQILGKRFRYLSLEHESSSNRRYDELQKGGGGEDDASSEPTSLDGPDSSERFIGLIFYPGEEKRSIARRLDIVLTRKSEWTFSLISWTGSSFFERDLRRYCAKERKLRFNSHGIFEKHSKQPVQRCNTLTEEQQVFEYLQLPWLAPEERCA